MAYKNASDKAQSRAARLLPKNVESEITPPNPEELRENLVKKKKHIEEEFKLLRTLGDTPSIKARKQTLRFEYFGLEDQLKVVNKILGFQKVSNLEALLIEVIKKDSTAAQFKIWVDRAKKIQRKIQGDLNDETTNG